MYLDCCDVAVLTNVDREQIGMDGIETLDDMAKALATAKPEAQLRRIGAPKYQTRIDTVGGAMDKLQNAGVLEGFKV